MIRNATGEHLKGALRPQPSDGGRAIALNSNSPHTSWLAPVLIILMILLTFGSVCAHDFTNWDDKLNVTYNPNLNPPTVAGLIHFWKHSYEHEYIPLTYTVWWLLARVARVETPDAAGIWLNPYIFHTANLLLHLSVSLLVFGLLRLLIARPWPACAGALLFALHPLQVEDVAWVTGLKDLLCALLSLIALWQYVLYAKDSSGGGSVRWAHYAVATVAVIAAMLAKPSAVTVPMMAASIDGLILKRPWRKVALALAPWIVISGAVAAIGIISQPLGATVGGPLWARPLVAADSLAFYLGKLLLPIRLSAVYHLPIEDVLASRWLDIAWIAPAVLAILAWVARRRAPWFTASAIIFVAGLLPVLGLAGFEYEMISTVADRYLYLAMLGPSLAVAFAPGSMQPRWIAVACLPVAVVFAALSFRQARFWHDSQTLFFHVLDVDPNSDVAYSNLAADALDYGRPEEAEQYARRAEDLNSFRPNNGITRGIALRRLGRYAEAAQEFLKVSQAHPDNTVALTNLAIELQRSGHVNQAIAVCRGLVRIDPQAADAHHFLAALLLQQHQTAEALPEAAEAVRLDPGSSENHLLYGKLLMLAGRKSEANQQFAAAGAIAPAGP